MNNIESVNESLFESIKHINEYGQEYWTARELLRALEYNEYRFFKKVIEKAMTACEASGGNGSDHFVQVHDMVPIGSGAEAAAQSAILRQNETRGGSRKPAPPPPASGQRDGSRRPALPPSRPQRK